MSHDGSVQEDEARRFSRDHAPFQGEVYPGGFRISRIIHYRNSFLPMITGEFQPGAAGTKVVIRMGLHPFVTVFLCVWFGGVGLGLFAVLSGIRSGQTSPAMLLAPVGMLLFGWGLAFAGFWFEARKQKRMLVGMFRRFQAGDCAQ